MVEKDEERRGRRSTVPFGGALVFPIEMGT